MPYLNQSSSKYRALRSASLLVLLMGGCSLDKVDLGDVPFKCSVKFKQCPPYYECREDIDSDPNPLTRGFCVPRGRCPKTIAACVTVDSGPDPRRDQRIYRDHQIPADQRVAQDQTPFLDQQTVDQKPADQKTADLQPEDANTAFQHTLAQLYFRGTPNGWNATPMTLVSDYTWQLAVTFAGNERFKFDVAGDWAENFGDNEPRDGVADPGGADIPVTAPGTYVISFNDQSRIYTLVSK
jgi:hypothetical protein